MLNQIFLLSVFIFIEFWLTENIDFGFNITGYNQINLYRNHYGGGIKVYHKKFEIKALNEISFINNFIEILTSHLISQNLKYVFIVIYRPMRVILEVEI